MQSINTDRKDKEENKLKEIILCKLVIVVKVIY